MSAKLGFELQKLRLPLDVILPVRLIKDPLKTVGRYRAIRDSIKEVGLVEPLMIHPKKSKGATYVLVDGHLRYFALKELGETSADCIIAKDDESFTYNARISRVSPIGEHRMILKAVQNGVRPERIAAALNLPINYVRASINLLQGIDEKAADLLKDRNISPVTIRLLKKVNAARQVEMIELMTTLNNFTAAYAEVLILGTPKEQLAKPEEPKKKEGLSSEEIARIEQEMETLQHDVKSVQDNYGEHVLTLTVLRGYLKKLLDDAKVVRFLTANYPDFLVEFESIAATESF